MSERRNYRSTVFDSNRWDAFRPRPDDIVISAPAKSGTTWLQRITACLVFGSPDLPDTLDRISPWLDHRHNDDDLATTLSSLDGQRHRRFVKTHLPADALPELPATVSYLVVFRDLRDVAFSYHNHLTMGRNLQSENARDPRAFWRMFFSGRRLDRSGLMPLSAFLDHLTSWWSRRADGRVLILHYQNLLDDLAGQIRLVADHLGVTVAEADLPVLVDACRFESMRSESDRLIPALGMAVRDRSFFHRGTSGQWRDTVVEEDLELYGRAVAGFPEDLRRWLEDPRA